MKQITKYFLNGLFFLAPVALTIYIFYLIFHKIDNLFPFDIPGLGFIVTLGIVMLIGFLMSNIITRSLLDWVDKLLNKLPFAKLIYSSIKDLIGAFVGDKKSFDRPVLVTLFSNSSVRAVGFITRDDIENWGLKNHAVVYFPQSYHFAGQTLIIPKENIQPLSITSSDAMAFIVSGGVAGK